MFVANMHVLNGKRNPKLYHKNLLPKQKRFARLTPLIYFYVKSLKSTIMNAPEISFMIEKGETLPIEAQSKFTKRTEIIDSNGISGRIYNFFNLWLRKCQFNQQSGIRQMLCVYDKLGCVWRQCDIRRRMAHPRHLSPLN